MRRPATATFTSCNGRTRTACPGPSSTFQLAAAHGDVAILQYLHANGCPWSSCDLRQGSGSWPPRSAAVPSRQQLPLGWRHLLQCCQHGHTEVLRWAHDNGCPWDGESVRRAGGARRPRDAAVGGRSWLSLRRRIGVLLGSHRRTPCRAAVGSERGLPVGARQVFVCGEARGHAEVAAWIESQAQ